MTTIVTSGDELQTLRVENERLRNEVEELRAQVDLLTREIDIANSLLIQLHRERDEAKRRMN